MEGIGDFFSGMMDNLFGGIFGGGSDDDASGAKGGLFARLGGARDSINNGRGDSDELAISLLGGDETIG